MSGNPPVEQEDKVQAANPGVVRKELQVKEKSDIHLCLLTDRKVGIAQERVLLVNPDGQIEKGMTDSAGNVSFSNLRFAKGEWVYIVLPDILEGWDESENSRQIIRMSKPKATGRDESVKDKPEESGGLVAHREKDKDQIDALAGGSSAVAFRSKDRTKYCLKTTKVNKLRDRYQIVVKRLTENEKFQHFTDLIETNRAGYTNGVMSYDAAKHRWKFKKGAVCNQFVNFFLGYWYNLNGAFTPSGSASSFCAIMEKDCELHTSKSERGTVDHRGFQGLAGSVLTPPSLDAYKPFTAGDLAGWNGLYKGLEWFAAPDNLFSDSAITRQLAPFNVYSITDGSKLNTDHHGGLLLYRNGAVEVMAADGKPGGPKYEIKAKPLVEVRRISTHPDQGLRTNLHLRVWRLKALRQGGFSPSSGGSEYRPDSDLKSTKPLRPALDQTPPRFIAWE